MMSLQVLGFIWILWKTFLLIAQNFINKMVKLAINFSALVVFMNPKGL